MVTTMRTGDFVAGLQATDRSGGAGFLTDAGMQGTMYAIVGKQFQHHLFKFANQKDLK